MKRSRAGAPNAGMGPSIFDIPNYILMEILSELPRRTICNCRCVCTFFRNLISDPLFAQIHLPTSHPCLMLRSKYPTRFKLFLVESIDSCVVEGGVNDDILIPNNTLFKFEPAGDLPTGLEVLSSCNGLICFYCPRTYNPYVICNPVINEYVIVPQIEKGFFDQCGSGFGFCPGTNQYKVLRFLSPRIVLGLTGLTKLEAQISTVGSNLWRTVGDAPRYLHWYSSGCFLNGALHWIVHNTGNYFESMCRFDFGKECFQPFPGPPQFRSIPGVRVRVDVMSVGLLRGCLSIFHYPLKLKLDIWVMKDYAVEESWTKEFVLELPWVVNVVGHIYQPLRVLSNGEILVLYALSVLLSFSTKDKSFRKVRVIGIPPVIRAMTYIPSFVSIKNAVTGGYS